MKLKRIIFSVLIRQKDQVKKELYKQFLVELELDKFKILKNNKYLMELFGKI